MLSIFSMFSAFFMFFMFTQLTPYSSIRDGRMEDGGWFEHFFGDHLPSSKGHTLYIRKCPFDRGGGSRVKRYLGNAQVDTWKGSSWTRHFRNPDIAKIVVKITFLLQIRKHPPNERIAVIIDLLEAFHHLDRGGYDQEDDFDEDKDDSDFLTVMVTMASDTFIIHLLRGDEDQRMMAMVRRPTTMTMMFMGSRTCCFTSHVHVLPEDEDWGGCDVLGGVAPVMNHALHDVVRCGLNHVLWDSGSVVGLPMLCYLSINVFTHFVYFVRSWVKV